MNEHQVSGEIITNQRWKLKLLALACIISAIFMFASGYLETVLNVEAVYFSLAGLFLSVFTFIAAIISVRCPSCKLSLFWYAVSKQKHDSWLHWLLQLQACPKCGCSSKSKHN